MVANLKDKIKVPAPEEVEQETQWITLQIAEIGEDALSDLAQKAAKNRSNAYAPYSTSPDSPEGYHVGAATLSISGKTYVGANIENVAFTPTSHAEQISINDAINRGEEIIKNGRRFIKALAVSHEGDSAPCGFCRQIMIEYGDNYLVVIADVDGKITGITSLKILLPYAFTPTHLGR